ncbi:MAG: hypothetical protein ACOYI6_10085 [Christensenellales bacterium]
MAKTETVDKRPLVLLIAFILGVLTLAFVFAFMDKTMAAVKNIGTSTFDAATKSLGITLGVAVTTPHLIMASIATVACGLAWLLRLRWMAVLSGVLYAIAMVLMPPWFYLVIVQLILSFAGAGKLEEQQQKRLFLRLMKDA